MKSASFEMALRYLIGGITRPLPLSDRSRKYVYGGKLGAKAFINLVIIIFGGIWFARARAI